MPPPAPNLPFPFRNSRHLLQAALTRPNELFSLFKLFYNNTTLLPISAQAMLKLSATVAPRDESALRIVYSLHLIGTQEIQMLVAQDQAQRGLLFVNGAEHEEHGDLGDKEQDANEQDLSDYEPEKEDDNGDKEDEDGHIKKKKSVSAQKTSAVKRKRTVDKEDDFEVIDDEDTNLYCYCRSRSHGYMVACDDPSCVNEWFHLKCAGLRVPPAADVKWWCVDCAKKMKAEEEKTKELKAGQAEKIVEDAGRPV